MNSPLDPVDRRSQPPSVSLSSHAMFLSIINRQNAQWREGKPAPIEQFLGSAAVPLSEDQQMSLICNELFWREQNGQTPELEEYQQRFPHLAKILQIQWQLDRLFDLGEQATTDTSRDQYDTPSNRTAPAVFQTERYALQEKIGTGGMGVVYKALDKRLQRVVALKQLTGEGARHPTALMRFEREARLVAQLNHPHIVPIFDTDQADAGPYIAMEYCEEGSLADRLRQTPLSFESVTEIVKQIAEGVEAAHRVGVVHRDLKPGNILISRSGDDDAKRWHVKVSDFGLAKHMDDADAQTRSGEILGTPAYMAPEQMEGGPPAQSPLVDVYAIGAVLYECLTGRPPIRGSSALETLRLLASTEPVSVKALQPRVPKDLASITHKCLQRDPEHRYASAAALAADLKRFQDGMPTVARPTPWLVRTWKWAKRNPTLAGTGSLVAIGTLLLLGLWASFTRELQVARNVAEKQSELATVQRQRAERNSTWAVEAVDKLITEVGEKRLADVPGMSETRKKLLSSAVEFSQRFFEDSQSSDPAALNDVALAHRRLAKIYRMLGENAQWLAQLESAAVIHRRLVDQFPNDTNYLGELGKTLNNLSNALADINETAKSIQVAEEGIELKRRAVKLDPTSIPLRSSLAIGLGSIGPKLRTIDVEKTERYYREADEIFRSWLRDDPQNREIPRRMAGLYQNWSVLLANIGRTGEAVELADKRVVLLRESYESEKTVSAKVALIESLSAYYEICLMHNKADFENERRREIVEPMKAIFLQYPEVVAYLILYQDSCQNLANAQRDHHRYAEAVRTIDEYEKSLLADSLAFKGAMIKHAEVLTLLGLIYLESDEIDKALTALDRSQAFQEQAGETETFQTTLLRAICYLSRHQPEKIASDMSEAWTKHCQIVTKRPSDREASRLLLLATSNWMLMHLRAGDLGKAEQLLNEVRQCQPQGREAQLAVMEGLLRSYQGDTATALRILEQHGRHPGNADLWPEHIPSLIAARCSENIKADKSSDAATGQQRLEQVTKLRQQLRDQALQAGWDIPLRARLFGE